MFIKQLNNQQVVVVLSNGEIDIIDIGNGSILQQYTLKDETLHQEAIAFLPSKNYLFLKNNVLDLTKQKWLNPFAYPDMQNTQIDKLCISPDEKWIAMRTEDGKVRLWDAHQILDVVSTTSDFHLYQ